VRLLLLEYFGTPFLPIVQYSDTRDNLSQDGSSLLNKSVFQKIIHLLWCANHGLESRYRLLILIS